MKLPLPCFLGVALFALTVRATEVPEPLWAYGFTTPGKPGEKAAMPGGPTHALRANEDAAEQTRPRHIDGSTAAFSLQQIRNGNDVADWFPHEHPALTPIMRHGPARLGEKGYGCGFCHMPNGKGRPENAPLAGLPAAYFVRQLQDLKSGQRASAEPRKANTLLMAALASAMTDEEMKEAASYFAGLPATPWIRVVETGRVPKTKIVSGMFIPIEKEKTEALAGRIIEVPESADDTELLRNPHTGFIAYVPIGSVRKGETLVTGKVPPTKTIACATCHGPDLKGVAEIPGIAGRSPSYLARQLYDIQQGTRKSALAQLMKPVVANLDGDDLVAIAAYVASLAPPQ